MSFWDFRRSVTGIQVLLDHGRERGLPAAALLAGSGLTESELADPRREVEAAQELQVVNRLLALLDGTAAAPGLPLQLGRRYPLTAYGIWGLGLLSSRTLRDAALLAQRYLPLTFAFTDIRLHEDGERAQLAFGEPALPPPLRRCLVERDMAAAMHLLDELLGPGALVDRVQLRRPAPPPAEAAAYAQAFGVMPAFGAAHDSFGFERAALDRPLARGNALTRALCEEQCRELVARRRAAGGRVAAAVRARLLQASDATLHDMRAMAAALHTSERTLRRQLQQEGQSFRALLDEVRAARAADWLAAGTLTQEQIAERLGFADASSFSQAFKRWHGRPPAALRRGPRRAGC